MRIFGRIIIFQTNHKLFKFEDCLAKIIVPLQLRIYGIYEKVATVGFLTLLRFLTLGNTDGDYGMISLS